jgi:hypothetical protein
VSPFQIVLEGVLLPMAAGLLPLAIGMRLWRREAPVDPSGWGLAVATAITFAIALRVQQGEDLWELRQKWQWLWVVGGAAAVSGVLVALLRHFAPRIPTVVAGTSTAVLVGGATLFLLSPPGFSETADRAIVVLAVAGMAWLATWPPRWRKPKDSEAHPGSGWADGLAFWLAASGLSGVVLASGWAKLAIPLGAVAALSMAAAVLSLRGRRDLGFAGLATLGAVLAAAAVVGWAYDLAGIPAWCFLALAFAPAAMRVPLPRTFRYRSVLRLAMVLAVVAAASGTAVVESGMLDSGEGDDGGSDSGSGYYGY